jgi:predicted kinase
MITGKFTLGIPGSGKSTWSRKQNGYKIISPDILRKKITGDINNQDMNKFVWEKAHEAIEKCIGEDKEDFIFDSTLVNAKTRHQMINRYQNRIKMELYVFHCNFENAYRRVKSDIIEGKDRSSVPNHVMERMWDNFLSSVYGGITNEFNQGLWDKIIHVGDLTV